VSWQVNYALENIRKIHGTESAQQISDDAIKITMPNRREAIAVISAKQLIDTEIVVQYYLNCPAMNFLCGYRKECAWEGGAIRYLESKSIGWGNAGTLVSAINTGDIETAAHKEYFFSYRIIRQTKSVKNLIREFDRVFTMTLANGVSVRVGMISEYEPTADAIRTFWDRFGPINFAWNINPNGKPTPNAIEAGKSLGCEIMKWEQLREILERR
jgi:hypothetical protein